MDEMLPGFNALVSAIVFGLCTASKQVYWINETVQGQRLVPVLPFIFGVPVAIVFLPDMGIRAAIGAGLVNALYASGVFKLGKTTLLGRDVEAKPKKDAQPALSSVLTEKD